MKSVFFLAAIAAPLIALAEPGDSDLAQVVRRQPGSRLLARAGIAPSSISPECQPQCTPIITTLDACNGVAPCECTQANYDSLGTCLTCLQALSAAFWASEGPDYASQFAIACSGYGYTLNDITIAVDPTGTAFSVDPFSIFNPTTTESAGSTAVLTAEPFPLLPTLANSPGSPSHPTQSTSSSSGKTGGAVGLSALQSLNAGVVGAVAAVAIVMGGFPL